MAISVGWQESYTLHTDKKNETAIDVGDNAGIIDREVNTYGDNLFDKLGAAVTNNKREVDEIVRSIREKGGEVRIVNERKMVYNARGAGLPGEIIIDEQASIGALRHEYRHFLDDEASGFIGLRILADNDLFWEREFNGYMEEYNLARSLGLNDIAKRILKEMRQRKNEIYGK